jgi:iron complex outermembrane recepter protein
MTGMKLIGKIISFSLFIIVALVTRAFSEEPQNAHVDSVNAHGDSAVSTNTQVAFTIQKCVTHGSTDQIIVIPAQNEITVFGVAQSLTSPSLTQAAKLKREIPGALTITENDWPEIENFKELQKYSPGVVTQSDGGTEVSRISIRGSGIQTEYEPLGLQLLLDGISFNEGDGGVNLEDFDLTGIQYAETYRGANAFKYGSYTLGGAINLVPLTGYTGAPIMVDVETGTYGTTNADVSISHVRGPYDYYMSATARYRNGGRQHSREDIGRLFGNFGYRMNQKTENRFYLTVVNLDRQIPGELTKEALSKNPLLASPDFVSQDIGRSYRTFRLADKLTIQNGNKRFDAGAVWRYRDMGNTSFYSEESRAGIGVSGSNNVGLTLNLAIQSKVFGSLNNCTIGLEGAYEREQSVHYANIGGQRGDSIALYVTQAENIPFYAEMQQYIGKKLSLFVGVQAIYAGRQFTDKFRTTVVDAKGDVGADTGLNFFGCNPKLGFMYEPGNNIQFFANVSRSWQPPSFSHLLRLESEEEDEAEEEASSIRFTKLSAQSAWTAEVGCRGDLENIDWELAIYRSWVRSELLSMNDVHGNTLGTINVPHSIHQGIEAGLTGDLLRTVPFHCQKMNKSNRLLLSQCYTFNDFHFDNEPAYHNNRIGGLPKHSYHAGLKYETSSGFFCGPEADCILSRYPADQANTLYADPYAVLNWSMGYECKKGLSGYVEIKNLLNKHYVVGIEPIPDARTSEEGTQVFEPGLGRAFYCGLQWRW